MNLTEKNGIPVCLKPVTGDDDLIVVTDKGTIVRTHLDQISTIGRDTQGVKVVSLYEGHSVASIAIVPRDDEENDDVDDDYIEDIEFETPQINFEQIDETEIEEDSEEEDEEDI